MPYRGVAPAMTDMVAGQIDLMFSSYVTAGPILRAETPDASDRCCEAHPKFPELPTMGEAGFPSVEMEHCFGLFGPAGMPDVVVRKLNEAFVEALRAMRSRTHCLPQGAVIIPGMPKDLADMIARDIVRLGQVVKVSGAKPE